MDYHQLYVAPAEVWPEFDLTSDVEMVQVMPDRRSLIIMTGIAMGPISLTVELVDAISGDQSADWDLSAEGLLQVSEPLILTAPTLDTGVVSPVFTPPQPGAYNFRLSARGRHEHYDQVVDTPTETYLLQFQSQPHTPRRWSWRPQRG